MYQKVDVDTYKRKRKTRKMAWHVIHIKKKSSKPTYGIEKSTNRILLKLAGPSKQKWVCVYRRREVNIGQ
jgi:hypothetical protein